MLLTNFVFMIILLSNFLFLFWPSVTSPCEKIISGRSLVYCVKFLDPLRGKLGNFCTHRGLPAFAGQLQRAGSRCHELGL